MAEERSILGVMAVVVATVVAVGLLLSGPACLPPQTEKECWARTKQGCYKCVESGGCGWCSNGCISLSEGNSCVAPISFVLYCPDSPFPPSVLNPLPYHLRKPDGGPADAGADAAADR